MKASKTNSCLVLMGSSEASYEHRFLREYEAPPPVGVLEVKALARKDGGARHASSWEGGEGERICFQRREDESLLWRYCREIS